MTPPPRALVQSRALREVYQHAERAAPTGCHVLILGERGVGKELLAQHLHIHSGRSGPLVALNCAAIQPSLAESTLFGHARGAFTGAQVARRGLVREAARGTLFLDEVGELSLDVQARLLRLLQEGVIQPVGEGEQPVDVRIVAATNRDLDREVAAGRFRADLRDRLHLVVLRVPPLRARPTEIVPLARHFLATAPELVGRRPRLALGAESALRAHAWPGNVRELRNAVLRAGILAQGETVTAREMCAAIADGPEQEGAAARLPRALDSLPPGRWYSMAELLEALHLTRANLKRRVVAWVASGALIAEGSGRRRRYRRPGGEGVVLPGPSPTARQIQARVLAWLRDQGPSSTGELSDALDVPRTTLKRAVRGLLEEGLVFTEGSCRATRLTLTRPAAAPDSPPAVKRPVEAEAARAAPLTGTEATAHEAVALRLAAEGALSARALSEALRRTVRTAERVLARLVHLGQLRPVGFARARRYLLPSPRSTVGRSGASGSRPRGERARARETSTPSFTLFGRALRADLLRVALALAATSDGATPLSVAERCALTLRDARRLLGTLGEAGLLQLIPGAPSRWALHTGEGG